MYSVKIFVLLVKQMGMATYFKKKKKKSLANWQGQGQSEKDWRVEMEHDRLTNREELRVMNYIEAEE